jgi:hypothetical protein
MKNKNSYQMSYEKYCRNEAYNRPDIYEFLLQLKKDKKGV